MNLMEVDVSRERLGGTLFKKLHDKESSDKFS